jgi:hypothetical protein
MKKSTFKMVVCCFALMTIVYVAGAQQNHFQKAPDPTTQNRFSDDVIIDQAAGIDMRNVKITSAFNGWLYTAFTTVDSLNNKGGVIFKRSKDGGFTWDTIDYFSSSDVRYDMVDLVVAGTDTNNLRLFIASTNHNLTTGTYVPFIDVYDATTFAYIGENWGVYSSTQEVYDIAIATDYTQPGVGASPYSVALVYSHWNSPVDSVVYVVSVDGGNTFPTKEAVAVTSSFYGKVAISYGRSLNSSNGRYFVAYEELPSWHGIMGHIWFAHTTPYIDSPFSDTKCLDSLQSISIGYCRHPSISCSVGNIDNDSSSVTGVVLCERAYGGSTADWDIIGFYNKIVPYYSWDWAQFDVSNNFQNVMDPDISFDPTYNNFLMTYYDSTLSKLPYAYQSFNMTTPTIWNYITMQYNETPYIVAPQPQVVINPAYTQAAFVWNSEGPGGYGRPRFDAEYFIPSGIVNNSDNSENNAVIFPNPVSTDGHLNITLAQDEQVNASIFSLEGKKMMDITDQNYGTGKYDIIFNAGNLSAGYYLCRVQMGSKAKILKIAVVK